jgi:hypothetical protein
VNTYKEDPLYPRIVRAVASILKHGKVVAPVDVLVVMDLLSREDLENWRQGRVPYLERVVRSNLTRLSRLLRILAFHAHDLSLVPSIGSSDKRRRFTKTGDPRVEKAYARRFTWPGKGPFHPPAPKRSHKREP